MPGLTLAGSRLYGISEGDGGNAVGMIFGMNMDGLGYTNLHSFGGVLSYGDSDGSQPLASLAALGTNLFGSCPGGGAARNGTVFRLNTDGGGFTNLHVFTCWGDKIVRPQYWRWPRALACRRAVCWRNLLL